MNDTEKLLRLQTMVLCDQSPDFSKVEPMYLVGETSDNEDSVFDRPERDGFYPVWITAGETTGYPGAQSWLDAIVNRYHIARHRVHLIPMDEPLNTKTEMEALVRYTQRERQHMLRLVAAPFHQLRSFLTILGAMKRLSAMTLKVYNLPGVALPWQAEALHSQGVLRATREDLIGTELERIARYTAQGDLAPVDEALAYLRQRSPAR